jgi:transposase
VTFYVGIDIAKFKHDCFIADEQSCVIRESFSFPNDKDGLMLLLSILRELKPKGQIKIGFESTGHYHFNLKLFLETYGFDYVEFNPLLVHKFVTTQTLRRTKTDKKDAYMIAKYLMTVDYKPYPNTFYHINNLKSLCRLRETLITDRTRFLNQITSYLDQIFPEFKPLFNNKLNKSALYLLTHYMTTKKMAKLTLEGYYRMKSKLRNPISYQKFSQVKKEALNTIGHSSESLEYALKTSLNTYLFLAKQIETIEDKIMTIYQSLDYHIHTIRGVGILTAACIASEIGNFHRFSTPNQIQAFAGLEPSRNDSGIALNKIGKMVKHGSSYLRKYLMNSAETFYVHNPKISDFYWKKRKEGKHHRVALSHVARKLINIIFSLEKHNMKFDPNFLK